ncbi:MAG: hypothetical protein ABIW84_09330 [Ilumatobacteraceae bacterium]
MVSKAVTSWPSRIVVVAMIAAVSAPAVTNRASFPLSTYPIYASARERVATINVAVGIDGAGTLKPLSLAAIADTDDPLIAQSTLDRAAGGPRPEELCRSIAARTGGGIEAIEIAREEHDLIERVAGRDSLLSRDVIARCPVP